MSTLLSVYVNGEKVIEYDKSTRHPGKQREYLDGMDLDMDEGIEINDEMITSPDKMQRMNYVAMSLLYGIHSESNSMIGATCAYLVTRAPELKQIRAIEKGEEVTMDLIFNEVN